MAKILNFNAETTVCIAPDDVLSGAMDKLKEVVVIGWTEDGDIYIASSEGKISEINLLLDVAKANLIEKLF